MKFLKVSTVYSSIRLRQSVPLLLLCLASSPLFAAGSDPLDRLACLWAHGFLYGSPKQRVGKKD